METLVQVLKEIGKKNTPLPPPAPNIELAIKEMKVDFIVVKQFQFSSPVRFVYSNRFVSKINAF